MKSALLQSVTGIDHEFAVPDAVAIPLVMTRQVHGSDIVSAQTHPMKTADGIYSFPAGTAVGVYTADCVPILMTDSTSGMVAAVHAGWQGTYQQVVLRAIDVFVKNGSRIGDIYVSIGPAIKSCCYDIPDERAALFTQKYGTKSITVRDMKAFIDIQSINHAQLLEAGVLSEHIEVMPVCTYCSEHNLYSFRRGDRDKRLISYIVPTS